MAKNLVIVESPAKAKTIEGYLGKDFIVKSSFGHVRDLPKKGLSIDLENNFLPNYFGIFDEFANLRSPQKSFFPHSNHRLIQNGHSLNIAFLKKLGSTKKLDRCYTNAKKPNLT